MSVIRIAEFDTWRPGYGLATVSAFEAGTTNLANIFTNEDCTITAANPQTLVEHVDTGISYGKFAAPLYTQTPFYLIANSVDQTGVTRPALTSLAGEDASEATVQVTGGTQDIALADQLARRIDVRDFGEFIAVGGVGASAATNNATLVAAIAQASAGSGGFVECPSGTYAFTGGVTIPAGVVLRGSGRVGTTLQSTLAGQVVIIGGARAGLSRLTLDGVTLVSGSIGIYAANKNEIVIDDVEVKRFQVGIDQRGGQRSHWRDVFISNCTTGYKGYGDAAAGAGGALSFNRWDGGKIELCASVGLDLRYIDAGCLQNSYFGITFDSNTDKALKIVGARAWQFRDCQWLGNIRNIEVLDATPVTTSSTVIGGEFCGGAITSGTVELNDTLDTIAFRRMTLSGVAVSLISPQHNVHVEDCREISVTISEDATAWRRHATGEHNAANIVTFDSGATKAWALTLDPGEHVYLEMKAVGRQRNGINYEFAHKGAAARRPGSTLAYEAQTGNYTAGNMLTGGTSHATARIVSDVDAGVTGTLTLYDITGTFVDGEVITDGSGGSAIVNGVISNKNCEILTKATLAYDGQTVNFTAGATLTGTTSGSTALIVSDADGGATGTLTLNRTSGAFLDNEPITDSSGGAAVANGIVSFETASFVRDSVAFEESSAGYGAFFVANGPQVEVRCIGAAASTFEWTIDIEVTSNFRVVS